MEVLTAILGKGDVYGQPGYPLFPSRYNLMVEFLPTDDLNQVVYSVKMMIPGTSSAADFSQQILPNREDRVFGNRFYTIEWKVDAVPPVNQKVFLMNVLEQCPTETADWIFDAQSTVIYTHDSVHGAVPFGEQRPVRILELFAGGYGGWAGGCDFLKQFLPFPIQLIGIDSSWDAVVQYAIGHSANIVDGHQPFDASVLQLYEHTIIWADINDESLHGFPSWLPPLSKWSPDFLCFSSPCPPWSTAGRNTGLTVVEGQLFAKATVLCKLLQPRVVTIEQVAGFPGHPDFQKLMMLLRCCGYHILWQGVLDSSQCGSSTRQRWLCLAALQKSPELETPFIQEWFRHHVSNPIAMKAILPIDDVLQPQVQVTEDALNMARSIEFLPNNGKYRLFNNQDAVLASRCHDGSSTTKTFMACYGSQHKIDARHLRERGLLVHFAKLAADEALRYWHPLEIMMQHVSTFRLFSHSSVTVGWRHAGNLISQPHAIFLLLNAFNMMKAVETKLRLKTVLDTLWASKLNANNTVLTHLDGGTILYHVHDDEIDELMENFQELLSFQGDFPANSFWDARQGFVAMPREDQTQPSMPVSTIFTVDTTQADDIQATAPFCLMQTGHITVEDGIFTFLVTMDMNQPDLEAVWQDFFTSSFVPVEDVPNRGCSIMLQPKTGDPFEQPTNSYVASAVNGELTILPAPKDGKLLSMIDQWNLPTTFVDQFGLVSDHHYGPMTLLLPVELDNTRHLDPAPIILAAFQEVHSTHAWNPREMEFEIKGVGSAVACKTLAAFWRDVIPDSKLKHLGLIATGFADDNSFLVTFSPLTRKCPIPPDSFWLLMSVCSFRYLFHNFSSDTGVKCQIKLLSRVLWEGFLPPQVTTQQIGGILNVSLLIFKPATPRILFKGKCVYADVLMETLADDATDEPLVFRLSHSCHGGGNKTIDRTQAKNSLATTLLEHGYDIKWVSEATDTITSRAGHSALVKAAQIPASENRIKAVLRLCQDCGVETDHANKQSQQLRAKQASNKAKRMTPLPPNPADYRLEAGYLLNQDKSEVQQIYQITTRASGLCLMSASTAAPWLRESTTLSKDELGILVLGPDLPCVTKLKHQAITIPCRDPQQVPVILSGILVQLGEKDIVPAAKQTDVVPLNKSHVVSLTMWKEDWGIEQWNGLLRQTNSTIRDILGDLATYDNIPSIWGRSLRKKGKAVPPADAESIQVHCAVLDAALPLLLSQSGFNSIFATPKSHDHRIDDSAFRVIWVPGTLPHVTSIASGSTSCLGLVKGKKTYGLRFRTEHFADAWDQINPGVPQPDHNGGSQIYRLEPLPYGCTGETIAKWSQQIGWSLKPLKGLGPKGWLIATNEKPPPGVLQFNGSPVLAQFLPPKQSVSSHRTILAGPKPKMQGGMGGMNGVLHEDPWAAYLKNSPGGVPQSSAPSQQPPTRAVEGPTEKEFQRNAARLQALESNFQELKQAQAEAAASQQAFQAATQQAFKAQETNMQTMVSNSIAQVRSDIDKSVKQALDHQTGQINQNLLDLKSMIASQQKRNRPKEHDDMDSDG